MAFCTFDPKRTVDPGLAERVSGVAASLRFLTRSNLVRIWPNSIRASGVAAPLAQQLV